MLIQNTILYPIYNILGLIQTPLHNQPAWAWSSLNDVLVSVMNVIHMDS